jgi:hypothetical protein
MIGVFVVPERRGNDGPKPKSLAERYWKRVIVNEVGCWEWNGSTNPFGYAKLGTHEGGWHPAHRVSWEIHFGPILDGLHVLHKCDNPPCSRPDHLFLGTELDNIYDKISKGRNPRGERHGQARISQEIVVLIRAACESGATQHKVAKLYGLSQQQVSSIVTRHTWKHVA